MTLKKSGTAAFVGQKPVLKEQESKHEYFLSGFTGEMCPYPCTMRIYWRTSDYVKLWIDVQLKIIDICVYFSFVLSLFVYLEKYQGGVNLFCVS